MEWMIGQWSAFADWAASQLAPFRILIGSLVLLAAYLVFALVLKGLGAWVRQPILTSPGETTEPRPRSGGKRQRRREDLPTAPHRRSTA